MDEKAKIEELSRKSRAEYYRAWRAKNRDKVAAINRRYWEKKAAARLAEQQKVNDDDSED